MCSFYKKHILKHNHAYPRHFTWWYFSNDPVSKSRGVAIGFHNSLTVLAIQVVSDPEGGFLIFKCKINILFTLINVYAPNQGQIHMLLALLHTLDNLAEGRIVLGRDLNIILDPLLDTTSTSPHFSLIQLKLTQAQIAQIYTIVDVWRTLHPTESDYTCHSLTHATYSRIDLFLVSHNLLS